MKKICLSMLAILLLLVSGCKQFNSSSTWRKNGITIEMVSILAGTFMMGSPPSELMRDEMKPNTK